MMRALHTVQGSRNSVPNSLIAAATFSMSGGTALRSGKLARRCGFAGGAEDALVACGCGDDQQAIGLRRDLAETRLGDSVPCPP